MENLKNFFDLLKDTFQEWNQDRAPRLAAAIAYYAALSIAPLLVVVIIGVGLIYNESAAQARIVQQITETVGPTAGDLVEGIISSASNLGQGLLSTVIGLFTLLFGAINVFSQLRGALNTIWNLEDDVEQNGIVSFLMGKLLSLGMVLVIIVLLLISLVISTVLSVLSGYLVNAFPGVNLALNLLSFLVSFGLITLLFALVYKYLPSAQIEWRDVGVGAAVTAILFILGERLLSVYLANSGAASIYGAAGSFVLILLWIYYSAQIILFGAEFTQVFSRRYGSHIEPSAIHFGSSEEAHGEQPA